MRIIDYFPCHLFLSISLLLSLALDISLYFFLSFCYSLSLLFFLYLFLHLFLPIYLSFDFFSVCLSTWTLIRFFYLYFTRLLLIYHQFLINFLSIPQTSTIKKTIYLRYFTHLKLFLSDLKQSSKNSSLN